MARVPRSPHKRVRKRSKHLVCERLQVAYEWALLRLCGTPLVEGVAPIPIFPWGYVGGAPHGYTADQWASISMGEPQTAILQRLGPLGPKEWERNTRFRQPSSLFTTEDILGNRLAVFYNKDVVGIPRANSIPQVHGSSPAPPSGNKAPDQPKKRELRGYLSPSSILRNAAKLPQSLPAEKPRSSTSADGENRNPYQGDQKMSTSSQDASLSQLKKGYDKHDSQAPVPNERLDRNPSAPAPAPASTEPRSALSVSLERFVNMSARLHCVEDENFYVDTIAWLVIGLGANDSRRRLFCFLDDAKTGVWHCLGDVFTQPLRLLIELESPEEACTIHGLSCKRVMVVQDELDRRRLRFKSLHPAE
ncbi:hypothetical protein FANTH_3368 [Fusarium anthophilum]|uniref:Uncharacterized protein n=1 Tax=Fusarium anthophilum TaxID=48485 RepID=A0A8H4ZS59_9HYPO|nr:hypothetical protein FANTH_3368 [Fusarium anthophilum]